MVLYIHNKKTEETLKMLKNLIKTMFIVMLIIGIYHSYIYMVKAYKFALYQDCEIKMIYQDLDIEIKQNICLQKLK